MKKTYQQRKTARFRQWTRKGYAAFSSLGLCVTIGQLRKNVTERALTKQSGWGLTKITDTTQGESRADHTVPASLPPLQEELLCTLLGTQLLDPFTPAAHPLRKDYSINCSTDAPNAFCNALSPHGEEQRKTHSVRLCVNTLYDLCV